MDKDEIKGIVEQIRNTHLSLVLVTFVLLATSFEEPARKYNIAIEQAESIHTLLQDPDKRAEVGKKQKEEAKKSASPLIKAPNPDEYRLDVTWSDASTDTMILESLGPLAYVSDAQYEQEDDIQHPVYTDVKLQPQNLAEFIRFWDHNGRGQLIRLGAPNDVSLTHVEKLNKNNPFLPYKALAFHISEYKGGLPAGTSRFALHAGVEDPNANQGIVKLFTYSSEHETPEIWMSIPFERLGYLYIQRDLININSSVPRWREGMFASSFSELNEITKNLKTLTFGELITELKDRANRERDRVELFGAKVNPELVTRWGLLILAVGQLYLWFHLQRLQDSFAKSTDRDLLTVSWIGFYPRPAAFWYTVASVLSPALLGGIWIFRQWSSLEGPWRGVTIITAGICAALGVLTVVTLTQVRAKLATDSSESTM